MKNNKLLSILLGLIVLVIFTAFKFFQSGGIKGTVSPQDAGVRAWAISATDTLKSEITATGMFEISNAKSGTYKLVIEAKPPFKNTARNSVTVVEGVVTDIGQVVLEKGSFQ